MEVVNIGLLDNILGVNKESVIEFAEANDIAFDNHVKETALQTVIGKIKNTASMIEFETSDKDLSYLLNIKPNRFQNSNDFKFQLIEQLLYDGECLVIEDNKMFYIADSFVFNDQSGIYENIVINGVEKYTIRFPEDVFHFKYHNGKLQTFINKMNDSYGALFSRVMSIQMRERQLRVYAKFKSMMSEENQAKFKKYLKELQKRLDSESVVVAPRQDNYELQEESQSYVGRPIKEVQDVEMMYIITLANILQVPPLLFSGDLADVSQHTRNLINQCVKPLMNIIVVEINAKYFRKNDFDSQGKRLKLNTIQATYTSEFDMANDVEKMVGTGVWTIDDVLDLQGKDRLNTVITTQRYLTKNIAPLSEDGTVKEG